MDRFSDETLVQLAKVSKKTNSSILLWTKEARGSPFGIDVGLKDTNITDLFDFFAGNVDDGMRNLVSLRTERLGPRLQFQMDTIIWNFSQCSVQ